MKMVFILGVMGTAMYVWFQNVRSRWTGRREALSMVARKLRAVMPKGWIAGKNARLLWAWVVDYSRVVTHPILAFVIAYGGAAAIILPVGRSMGI